MNVSFDHFVMFILNYRSYLIDTEIATAVTWAPDSQLISCSDDKTMCKWTADGESAGKTTTINAYVTGISWFPVVGKQVRVQYFFPVAD